jgi:uncharacterized protein
VVIFSSSTGAGKDQDKVKLAAMNPTTLAPLTANLQAIDLDRAGLDDFCKRHHIRQISLFGSILRSDFTPQSDVDFLVEFCPERTPGLLRLASMENELTDLIGRKVDLRTSQDLSCYFRQAVLNEAVAQYVQS